VGTYQERAACPKEPEMVEYEVKGGKGADVRLVLRGELAGRLWADPLRRALEAQYRDEAVRRIRADLSGLSFLDHFGVATLMALRRESTERGKRFVIQGATGQVRDKLRVTGVHRMLEGADESRPDRQAAH
jgi:anti-anti-sigma factor